MNTKFELLKTDYIEADGVKLYRIKALKDFYNICVGELGGYIEKESNLDIYGNAWVSGDARVSGNARVYGNAWVYGDAWEVSPLQIQGTKHFVNMQTKTILRIGCQELTINEWEKQFLLIGKQNGYTQSEIEEYHQYILLAKKLYGGSQA